MPGGTPCDTYRVCFSRYTRAPALLAGRDCLSWLPESLGNAGMLWKTSFSERRLLQGLKPASMLRVLRAAKAPLPRRVPFSGAR